MSDPTFIMSALCYVFGNWVGYLAGYTEPVLPGGPEYSLLMNLISKTSFIAVIIYFIVAGWNLFTLIIHKSQRLEQEGQRVEEKSPLALGIKAVVAFAFISSGAQPNVPPAQALNIANIHQFTMTLALWGNKIGDLTEQYAADLLLKNINLNVQYSDQMPKLLDDVINMQMCTFATMTAQNQYNSITESQSKDSPGFAQKTRNAPIAYTYSESITPSTILGQYAAMPSGMKEYRSLTELSQAMANSKAKDKNTFYVGSVNDGNTPTTYKCGVISFPGATYDANKSQILEKASDRTYEESVKAFAKFFETTASISQQLYNLVILDDFQIANLQKNSLNQDQAKQYQDILNRYYEAFSSYLSAIKLIGESNKDKDAYMDEIKKSVTQNGWALFPIYYKEIEKISDIINTNMSSPVSSITSKGATGSIETCGVMAKWFSWLISPVCLNEDKAQAIQQSASYTSKALKAALAKDNKLAIPTAKYSSSISNSCTINGKDVDCNTNDFENYSMKWLMNAFLYSASAGTMNPRELAAKTNGAMKNIAQEVTFKDYSVDPFRAMSELGKNIYTAINMIKYLALFAKSSVDSVGSYFKGQMTSTLYGWGFIIPDSLINMLIDTLLSMIIALFALQGLALALGYLLPLYPVLTFAFIVIGYLKMIIEAVVILPFLLATYATSNNVVLAGKEVRGIMILLAVLLTPFLSVMGYIVMLVIASIGFAIINLMFFTVIESYTIWIWVFVAIMYFYLNIMYRFLANVCVPVMHNFRDRVLDYVSGGIAHIPTFGEANIVNVVDSTAEVMQVTGQGYDTFASKKAERDKSNKKANK
ncbi:MULTISPECIES: DotA/TraY family protein [Cysteiniphilum]|uniref:Uncharacterized protein n=1 Tax=Cysteiniphilum litorale TaxID=2056700 RepID=A0A8J2Z2V5_9GAMM|nr:MULTISPECIES: DotA/TraY family protein [Cysteiniphilum]GGF91713.1 hypothetical protein GCM10010995_06130 [Cysteiniphilum litorale]